MTFVDRVTVEVQAGRGGDGMVSFLREAFRPRGGPDGGDGGDGGSVILVVSDSRMTLRDLASRKHYRADHGRPGGRRNMTGRGGEDLEITIPAGTLVIDAQTDEVVADLTEPGARFVLAKGGSGGQGNAAFKDAINQAPRVATKGGEGQGGNYRFELKLIAEVGLVGLPNAGKSTFLGAVTRASPRVAAYPFTTLHPNLGVATLGPTRELVIADIPGLIAGASEGKGLGDEFLRHVERTKVLLHLVDGTGDPELGGLEPVAAYQTIRGELTAYAGADLDQKPELVAVTKIDALGPEAAAETADRLSQAIGKPVRLLSSVSGEGTKALLAELRELLDREDDEDALGL